MEVYVIRHTEVAIATGICYGQSDVGLKDTFKDEIEKLKVHLPNSFDKVYSSPLLRCSQLAQEFTDSIVFDDRLKEMDFGEWEMQFWDKIPLEAIQPWYDDFVFCSTPKGESFEQVYQRLCVFFEELRQANHEKILVVTHGGIIRSIWCYLLQIPLQNAFKISVSFGEVFHFHLGKESFEDIIELGAKIGK